MTQEQELAILRPWAASLPEKYDYVYFFKNVNGLNVYHLFYKQLIGHKCGTPELAIIVDNYPIRLDIDEIISVLSS